MRGDREIKKGKKKTGGEVGGRGAGGGLDVLLISMS